MEKLDKELSFVRQPRMEAPSSPALSESDALLQLLLPLLPGDPAPAGPSTLGSGDLEHPFENAGQAKPEDPSSRENFSFMGPRLGANSGGTDVLPEREEAPFNPGGALGGQMRGRPSADSDSPALLGNENSGWPAAPQGDVPGRSVLGDGGFLGSPTSAGDGAPAPPGPGGGSLEPPGRGHGNGPGSLPAAPGKDSFDPILLGGGDVPGQATLGGSPTPRGGAASGGSAGSPTPRGGVALGGSADSPTPRGGAASGGSADSPSPRGGAASGGLPVLSNAAAGQPASGSAEVRSGDPAGNSDKPSGLHDGAASGPSAASSPSSDLRGRVGGGQSQVGGAFAGRPADPGVGGLFGTRPGLLGAGGPQAGPAPSDPVGGGSGPGTLATGSGSGTLAGGPGKPGDGPTARPPGSVGASGGPPPGPVGDGPTVAPGAPPPADGGSSMTGDTDAPGARGPQNPNGDHSRGVDLPTSQPARSASLDPAAVRLGVAASAKGSIPGLVDAAQARGVAGLAAKSGAVAAAAVAGEANAAGASLGAAAAQGDWGKQDGPGGFGQQVAMSLAGLASDSVDARRQAFGGTARARSDLENLEPVALGMQQRRTMQSFAAPAAMQPVVAQIAADMYRLQTARLDQLMASRAADEDGEPPPLDADEAMQRQRAVKEVDLGGMWRWDLAPSILLSPLADAVPIHLPFRAALLTVTLQDPAAVLPMFAREAERDALRLYVPDPEVAGSLRTRWEAVQLGPQAPLSWMAAAEQAFMRAYPQGDAREALQALLGREAKTEKVVGDEASAKRLWKQLCLANSPRQVPTVLRTLALEGIPLAADHAYGVLGTFVRDGAWMVTLCDPLAAPDDNVLSVPFAAIRRSADTLTVSARAL